MWTLCNSYHIETETHLFILERKSSNTTVKKKQTLLLSYASISINTLEMFLCYYYYYYYCQYKDYTNNPVWT